jgi:cell division protein ZapB
MLEELDALDSKMRELSAHVRQLRDENQVLRRQLAASQSELATLNERVAAATRRLDSLIEDLPGELRGNGH